MKPAATPSTMTIPITANARSASSFHHDSSDWSCMMSLSSDSVTSLEELVPVDLGHRGRAWPQEPSQPDGLQAHPNQREGGATVRRAHRLEPLSCSHAQLYVCEQHAVRCALS